jgi:hypothetical protein
MWREGCVSYAIQCSTCAKKCCTSSTSFNAQLLLQNVRGVRACLHDGIELALCSSAPSVSLMISAVLGDGLFYLRQQEFAA